jgi:hypothetical protein
MLVGAAFCEQQLNYWYEKYEGMWKREERESYIKELTLCCVTSASLYAVVYLSCAL